MSRSGYDDCIDDNRKLAMYRGRVASAMRGRRGQQLLVDLRDAMDAMPEKRLIAYELQTPDGCCAIGCVGARRGHDFSGIDPYEDNAAARLAETLNIAECLVREVEYENDEGGYWGAWKETPEQRWKRMRAWVDRNIRQEAQ